MRQRFPMSQSSWSRKRSRSFRNQQVSSMVTVKYMHTYIFESKGNDERKARFTLKNMIDVAKNAILNPTL
jgi:hypothetical protein